MLMITLAYYALVAGVVLVLAVNFLRSRRWEQDALYLIVLVPFVLRLLRLK
jgi:hypothetical protein